MTDARRILAVQALRAFAYGLGSVLIGVSLARRGLSGVEVGGILSALLAGAALVSLLLARYGDRLGRRRAYIALLVVMGVAGSVFALTAWLPALVLAALPVAARLSSRVEAGVELEAEPLPPLHRSRGIVYRLAGLFALDSLGGGFVVQAFIAYWFSRKFGTSAATLGFVFFGVAILQALSFQAAVRLAERIGLLRTMVFTHLPSNVLLALVPFMPNQGVAIALLLGRFALSQMDVPTRQAYVVGVVEPSERTAAAAYTNTARYATRPIGPLLAAPLTQIALGIPFVVGGAIKCVYDLGLYAMFRRVRL